MAWANLALELAMEFAAFDRGNVWERSTKREWLKYQVWKSYRARWRETDPEGYARMLAMERARRARMRAEGSPEYRSELEKRRRHYARIKSECGEAYLRHLERNRQRYRRDKDEGGERYALRLMGKRNSRAARRAS